MRNSFSDQVKTGICNEELRVGKCCLSSFLHGICFGARNVHGFFRVPCAEASFGEYATRAARELCRHKTDRYEFTGAELRFSEELLRYPTVPELKKHLDGCGGCINWFLRGLFLFRGSVTDPKKEFHLEFKFKTAKERDDAAYLLSDILPNGRYGQRKGVFLIYFKESESIEDIIARCGNHSDYFYVVNVRIVKQARADANRAANCDSANIVKSLSATKKYIAAIRYLQECGAFETMSDDLKETARLRLEFESLPLAEIGQKCAVPISKSGVAHRLDKILKIAQDRQGAVPMSDGTKTGDCKTQ